MNVLSLFDGMSCGQIALNRAGIKYDNYFASEIDKYAIQVTQRNYPNTIQLGDITKIKAADLPKIDLIIGGSPCQGFSFAGKQLAFDDPRSKLFFEFVRLVNECKPKYFLLENVKMKKEFEIIISKYLGVAPIEINSALVSAQNRVRLYWTNIANEPYGLFGDMQCTIPQPKDKGILLRDILETDVPEKYYLSEKMLNYFGSRAANFNQGKVNVRAENEKATTLCASMASCDISDNFVLDVPDKSYCIDANYHKGISIDEYVRKKRRQLITESIRIPEATSKGFIEVKPGQCFDFENPNSETRRGRKMDHKSNCLMAKETDFMQYTTDGKIRRLTPVECERLQTVPDNYTNCVSDTQRYRMLGNGWTVDVIAHIFSYINQL